jgi:hypothetical protein
MYPKVNTTSRVAVGAQLKSARETAGFSFREAVAVTEIPLSTLQKHENGVVLPRADEMLRYADAYARYRGNRD